VASNGQEVRVISSGRLQRAVPIDLAAEVALTDPAEATLVIWTAKLRIDRVATFQVNALRTFNAAGLIAPAAEASAASAVIAPMAAAVLAAIASVAVEDSVVAALGVLADSAGAAVDSGAAGDN
jgi:hypothetical protein